MRAKIQTYLTTWASRGYPDDIPDEVPDGLMDLRLAPSWKAVAIAILKNDHSLRSLGFTPTPSRWYGVLKRVELQARAARNEGDTEPGDSA